MIHTVHYIRLTKKFNNYFYTVITKPYSKLGYDETNY